MGDKFLTDLIAKNICDKRRRFKGEIEASVVGSKKYTLSGIRRNAINLGSSGLNEHKLNINVTSKGMRYQLLVMSKFDGRTAVLNPASFSTPGGCYTNGIFCTEEDICACTTLFEVLTKCDGYYAWNGLHDNKGLYANVCLYTPNIVIHDNNKKTVGLIDVISCSPPNYDMVSRSKANKAVRDRIEMVFNIAVRNGVRNLILCGFGCGFDRSDIDFIVNAFHEMCILYYARFDNITFVVSAPAEESAFSEVFGSNWR